MIKQWVVYDAGVDTCTTPDGYVLAWSDPTPFFVEYFVGTQEEVLGRVRRLNLARNSYVRTYGMLLAEFWRDPWPTESPGNGALPAFVEQRYVERRFDAWMDRLDGRVRSCQTEETQ